VLSFEPDDARRDFLKEQVMVNGLHPLIYIDSRVVGTKEETLIFSEHSVSKNIYVEAGVPRIAVSIDSLELEKTPNMVKIDAKGYDLEVIQGMRQLLEHEDMKAVICSFSEDIEPEIRDLTREIIRSEGFKICSYDPVNRVLEESTELDKELMLFVRDLDFAQQRLMLAKSFSWFNKQI
jgi:FkbM family methyltransferase